MACIILKSRLRKQAIIVEIRNEISSEIGYTDDQCNHFSFKSSNIECWSYSNKECCSKYNNVCNFNLINAIFCKILGWFISRLSYAGFKYKPLRQVSGLYNSNKHVSFTLWGEQNYVGWMTYSSKHVIFSHTSLKTGYFLRPIAF